MGHEYVGVVEETGSQVNNVKAGVAMPAVRRLVERHAEGHGYTAAHKDGPVKYTAHELRHVFASLLIASGATDMQVTTQMGDSKIETTKNIYGHLFAQDRSQILKAINEAVSRRYVQEDDSAEGEAA